jgi:nickel-dependent lactate racemase
MKIFLPYGNDAVSVEVLPGNLIGVFSPKDIPAVASVSKEIARALRSPIGAAPLREAAMCARSAVIVCDDNTRLTPAAAIVPAILNELNAGGVRDSQVTVIIALGTHRPMTEVEIRSKFGDDVLRRVAVKNHCATNPRLLVDLGTTPDGSRVQINREVYEADFKIGVGSIVPHHIPGFAGGAKIVQPGVCGEQTTADTHLLSVQAPRSWLGVEDNPVRKELNRIARQVGMNLLCNTVLNRTGGVVGAFYGDLESAFHEGVRLSKEVYCVEISEPADIVVASSHPCDLEFWQAHKTIYPSDLAIKPGGTIILVTPCPEGVAVTHPEILGYTGLSAECLRQKVQRKEIADEVAAALAIAWAQVKERENVCLVSDGITAEEAGALGFRRFENLQAAFDAALQRHGPGARVTVLTHAPDMLPLITAAAKNSTARTAKRQKSSRPLRFSRFSCYTL